MFVTHGITADFEGKDLTITDNVREGDAFGSFDGLDRLTGRYATQKRETVEALFSAASRENIDRAAAIMCALKKAFLLQICDVFMHGGERAEAEAAGDLLVGGRVAVAGGEGGEKVEDLFLPTRNCHGLHFSE